jgi:N-acetylmuramoyl-L-alanine amidase
MTTVRKALCVFAIAFAAFAADPVVPVKVSIDASGSSTRVVLTFPKKVACATAEDAGRIKVVCDAAIAPDPGQGTLDDAILKGFGPDGARSLVFMTGRGYTRLDTFELRNPTRLVLDLQGARAGKAVGTPAPPAKALPVIVLDPGHGGVETGATGPSGLQEKVLTLDLAMRLKSRLERQGATVVLTRDEDRVLTLDERTAIANHNRAILFISIHLNASKRKTAVGAETYYLSTGATDDEARTPAGLENKAYEPPDGVAQGAAPKAQPDHGLELILWDLAQNSFLRESSRLAEAVQSELNAATGVKDRGVRQAPFTVLMGATMPAILIEAGFISNPDEEARFKDDAYKDRVVDAIARAVATIAVRP